MHAWTATAGSAKESRGIAPTTIATNRFWIACVLWLASNLFVTGMSILATWETNAHYYRMANLCRWDCPWYAIVVQSGYSTVPLPGTTYTTWSFHPLFPLTVYPLHHWFKLSLYGSVVLTGKLELLLAIYAFLLMVSREAETKADYWKAASLVAFNPYVVYAHAGYAEPLYFGLIALAFYYVGRDRWVTSGIMGGLASATRLVGFVFVMSYVIVWLKQGSWRVWRRKLDLNWVIGLLLCPLGMAIFSLYMYHKLGDALVQQHVQLAWGKMPGNPFRLLWFSLETSSWPFVWGVMVVVGLILSIWLACLKKAEYGLFLAISILIPFSATWIAAARYIWWQPPFLYAIYLLLRRCTGCWVVYMAFAAGMAGFLVVASLNGRPFTI
jgi:Glycosyltransferase family 87